MTLSMYISQLTCSTPPKQWSSSCIGSTQQRVWFPLVLASRKIFLLSLERLYTFGMIRQSTPPVTFRHIEFCEVLGSLFSRRLITCSMFGMGHILSFKHRFNLWMSMQKRHVPSGFGSSITCMLAVITSFRSNFSTDASCIFTTCSRISFELQWSYFSIRVGLPFGFVNLKLQGGW